MMLRTAWRVAAGVTLSCALAMAAEKSDKPEFGLCPISGEPAAKSASMDYKGGKLYFCCPGCVQGFKDQAAKYEAKANLQLVATGQAHQVACPMSGKKANPSVTVNVAGTDVQLCCGGCKAALEKADAKSQMEIVFVKGFDKGFKVEKK